MRFESDGNSELQSLHRITSRILKKVDKEMSHLKTHRFNREHKQEYFKQILDQ